MLSCVVYPGDACHYFSYYSHQFFYSAIPDGFEIEMEPSEDPLEQDLVQLKCNADNYTYENLRWYRLDPQAVPPELDCKSLHQYAESLGGKLSFQTTSNSWVLELTITNIQLQDEGNYVCEVQNRRSGEKHCHRKYIPVKGEGQSMINLIFYKSRDVPAVSLLFATYIQS